MGDNNLSKFFENYLTSETIFTNKKSLQHNYTPENIPHRDEQIEQLATILAPALRMEKPSNLFIYGKTGTGKTCVTQHVMQQILNIVEKKKLNVKYYYLNCKLKKVADTEYRLIAQLARAFGKDVPATGLPTEEVYKLFIQSINTENQLVILVLDEIDQLVNKAGDGILYNLTRLNSELTKCQLSIIGISNDLMFTDNLDPRIKSSLSEEELVFPPYNAIQLQDILKQRSNLAFKDKSIEEGVIEKCAAYAAREHGDARRALELLRVAGELAERKNDLKIRLTHLDEAEEKIEKDRIIDTVRTQPKQFQITLYSILNVCDESNKIFTGEVYEYYKKICAKVNIKPLTQRRVSDIIAEFDMLGIINSQVISKGRYGRTKEIVLAIHSSTFPKIKEILTEGLGL
ncbi:MAG: ORC1-type DNA replication protein [Nanoarchaeota archaeon]